MTTPPSPKQTGQTPDGVNLLNTSEAFFRKYTIQPTSHVYVALAVYVAYTHAADVFDFAPRLVLTSAEKRSGKTRTMEIVRALSHRPLTAANATPAAIFRSLGGDDPVTLCSDEADTIFGTRVKAEQNEDLRGLLNAGFQKGTPVLRTVGPQHEVTAFETFAPAVLAAIGQLPDTITDRGVNIRLRRRKHTEQVNQFRLRRDLPPLIEHKEKLSDWVRGNLDVLSEAEPDTPLEDRAADVWEPLLAIADLAGGDWPERARLAAVALTRDAAENDSEQSEGMELLADIRDVTSFRKTDFIQSTDLVNLLLGKEESRWRENGLSARRLSDLLKPYQVRPGRAPSGNGRGYRTAMFEDVFDRYLPTTRQKATEVSETPPDQGEHSVALKTTVTSKRQTEKSDSDVSPGQTTNLSHLSRSDALPTENSQNNGRTLTDKQLDDLPNTQCADCNKTIKGRYAKFNGPQCPTCKNERRTA